MPTLPTTHSTVHSRVVAAPAAVVYDLIADVTRWPVVFGPSLHAEHRERTRTTERFQLWALVNDEVKTWVSRRELDSTGLRVTFEQERSQDPIASMGGEWRFRPLAAGSTEVVLLHHFAAVGDRPDAVEWITAGVDANSEAELAALTRIAELAHEVGAVDGLGDIVLSFEDDVPVAVPAAAAFSFVERSDLWPDRLPHVRRVALREPQPGIQDMEMDTVTPDGSTHTTRSIRLCFPGERIVYKQLVPPALLLGHSGTWTFVPTGDGRGATVTAQHNVAIDPTAVTPVLGTGATLGDARSYVRDALSANSRTTLEHAGASGALPTGAEAS